MKPVTLIEIIDAAHLTVFVDGPYSQRGGIMMVGPPETLRTTMIDIALAQHPSALVLGDLNMRTLTGIKDELTNGRYSTLGFLDYQKLYERHGSTASNMEGTIRQLIEEGFTRTSHEDPTSPSTRARVLVIAAVVESFFKLKAQNWKETGFLRRWLTCFVYMPHISRQKLVKAVHDWEKLQFDGIKRITPTVSIPYNITEKESAWLQLLTRDQASQSTPFVLMKKIYMVLKWKYRNEPRKVRKIIEDFAPSLTKNGAPIEL